MAKKKTEAKKTQSKKKTQAKKKSQAKKTNVNPSTSKARSVKKPISDPKSTPPVPFNNFEIKKSIEKNVEKLQSSGPFTNFVLSGESESKKDGIKTLQNDQRLSL